MINECVKWMKILWEKPGARQNDKGTNFAAVIISLRLCSRQEIIWGGYKGGEIVSSYFVVAAFDCLFGMEGLPYFMIGIAVSYMLSGYYGLPKVRRAYIPSSVRSMLMQGQRIDTRRRKTAGTGEKKLYRH